LYGLIHVDFNTQKRTIKSSGYWYGNSCISSSIMDQLQIKQELVLKMKNTGMRKDLLALGTT